MLTVAAVMAVAGVAVALVVVRAGSDRHALPMTGEGSGTVTLEPELVEPREPAATLSPSSPEPTIVPIDVAEGSEGAVPINEQAGATGVNVGSVGGLYPGHRVELGVTYVNPYSFPIALDTVNVTATGSTRCSARYLMPTPQRAHRLRLPSGSSVNSTLEVGMRRTAPDACQGVRFAVSVHVTAVKV